MVKINYTIIIPHKNSTELLQRCLNSIPRRCDIQIIVVDDNSDSDKIDFTQFPCLNDPSVEIIFSKEGKGAGFARNTGLAKACGKWILFADADDYFTGDFLEHLDKYIDSDYDLIYFGIYHQKIKNQEPYIFAHKNSDRLMREAINEQKYDEYKYRSYVPWGKIIKLALIKEHNILFDETRAANDKMFSLKTAYYAKNIHFDAGRIYIYVRGFSLITKNKSPQANFDRFYVYVRMNRFFEDISRQKYQTKLLPPLIKLFNIKNPGLFLSGLKVLKENNFNIYCEILKCFYRRKI